MLGKSKEVKDVAVPVSRPRATGEKTIITKDISIEGKIRGKEDLVIEGTVKGSIQLEGHHLTIGPNGQVEAEVIAENVTISGRLVGNIKALGKVEITKEANFNGEIRAKHLSVEDGAYLKAMIELDPHHKDKAEPTDEPLKQKDYKAEPTYGPLKQKGYGDEAPRDLASDSDKGK